MSVIPPVLLKSAVSLAAVCVLSVGTMAAPQAQAQSSYSVTTLRTPYIAGFSGGNRYRLDIDNSNRVHGSRSVFSLTVYLASIYLGSYPNGDIPRAGTWAPSTATSVTPGNLSGLPHTKFETMTASDNGAWTLLMDTSGPQTTKLYSSGQLQTIMIGTDYNMEVQAQAVNNQGSVAGHVFNRLTVTFQPFIWRNGTLTQLPTGNYRHGKITAINNQDVAVGYVYDSEYNVTAARWVQGQLELPAQSLGYTRSSVLKINDGGALVVSLSDGDPAVPIAVVGVLQNGRLTPLQSSSAVYITDFNNAGVAAGYDDDQRAKLWKDGQEIDVTSLVASKGVRLPSGAVVARVWSINDSGSIVADYYTPGSGRTFVRLTARP